MVFTKTPGGYTKYGRHQWDIKIPVLSEALIDRLHGMGVNDLDLRLQNWLFRTHLDQRFWFDGRNNGWLCTDAPLKLDEILRITKIILTFKEAPSTFINNLIESGAII